MSRTFLLGVGAQKAGTSWIYRQLTHYPGFKTGRMKEYHIWDVREVPTQMFRRRKIWHVESPKTLSMYLMEKFPSLYFSHFQRLLSEKNSLACDITPSYCALAPETISQIKQNMTRRGIEFKCLFIMRDPVQRCLSAFNMNRNKGGGRMHRNKGGGRTIVSMSADVDAAFMQYVQSDQAKIRTEYERTISSLRTALEPEDYRIVIYEEMFEAAQLEALQTYLGITFKIDATQARVNATEYNTNVSEKAQAFCRDSFATTYDDVAQYFPQIKTLWSS